MMGRPHPAGLLLIRILISLYNVFNENTIWPGLYRRVRGRKKKKKEEKPGRRHPPPPLASATSPTYSRFLLGLIILSSHAASRPGTRTSSPSLALASPVHISPVLYLSPRSFSVFLSIFLFQCRWEVFFSTLWVVLITPMGPGVEGGSKGNLDAVAVEYHGGLAVLK